MADKFEFLAELREDLGKGASRRFRRLNNQVPAIIYGAGKASTPIMINQHQVENALKNQAFYSHILTIKMKGLEEKVVLKALQRHPSKPLILHADFLRIIATEKLTMNVPLHFINEDIAPGVKLENGAISHLMNEVEIRCLPADLPEYIEVDVGELNMDESVLSSQLKLPNGVEIVSLMQGDDKMVASLHKPHVMAEIEEVAPPTSEEVPVVGEEETPPEEGE